jgi:N-acetylglucosamine-6-phosphate deacetylase
MMRSLPDALRALARRVARETGSEVERLRATLAEYERGWPPGHFYSPIPSLEQVRASFIVDGIHLPGSFLKVALRAKGVERAVLVTDASSPAGCAPGRYRLGEQDVDLTADNRVVLAGQERLAGSALKMDRGVENLMRLGELSLADAVRLATVNASRAGRVPGRARGLVAGDRADFVLFDFDAATKSIKVQATYVGGRKVWSL